MPMTTDGNKTIARLNVPEAGRASFGPPHLIKTAISAAKLKTFTMKPISRPISQISIHTNLGPTDIQAAPFLAAPQGCHYPAMLLKRICYQLGLLQ